MGGRVRDAAARGHGRGGHSGRGAEQDRPLAGRIPADGCPARTLTAIPGDRPYDRNAAYNSVNTGKKGITLDLNYAEARDALLELVSISDVFAENFSARVLPNLGLEYPALREVNPSIVLLRMPAYGCTGPYATYMGNGGSIEPMSGITSLLGYPGGPPMNSGVMHTDPFAGMMATAAIMIALHHRARTGQGQEIDLSQQETSIGLIADRVIEYSMNGTGLERRGNRSDRLYKKAPHDNYRCADDDSWVAIAVRSDDEWGRLCAVMDAPELARDQRFMDLGARLENVDELDAIISDWTRDKDAYEVTKLLQAEGIPSAPVLKATELADNPQLREARLHRDHRASRDRRAEVRGGGVEAVADAGQAWRAVSHAGTA